MTFLAQLADQISSQYPLDNGSAYGMNSVIDGSNNKYGSLGDFSKNINKFVERRYVEEGYLRNDPYTTTAKQFEILMQEPNATILVKKRMFSSLGDNYRPDYMDNSEKLFYKASRVLFQNKCNQIAALERLSKIAKITAAIGNVNEQLLPIIITLTDQLNYSGPTSAVPTSSGLFGPIPDSNSYSTNKIGSFTSVIDKLRKVYAFNRTAPYTTWVSDNMGLFQSTLGAGTGVIEVTNFTNLNTATTVDLGAGGNFSFTISDPYESMLITDYDIEIALSDAANMFYNHKIFQFGSQSASNVIQSTQSSLNQARSARGASTITINTNPTTLINTSTVQATIDDTGQELIFAYDSSGSNGFAGLGGSAGSVTVYPEYLQGGDALGFNGLATTLSDSQADGGSTELSQFQTLISAIYTQLQMQSSSQAALKNSSTDSFKNKTMQYARRKMRFNYTGQVIIQPMDVVHIYMSSKSRFDNQLISGLNNMLSGAGILQNPNNNVNTPQNVMDSIYRPSGGIPLQLEKATYVGANFPNHLWGLLRTQFVTEQQGTHVFAGVVDEAPDNWSDGHFNIEVRGRDNSVYFEQGKVNFKPGADVFNGSWFDPLTPFKTNFDTISYDAKAETPELLDENLAVVANSAAESLAKFKLGPFAGTKMTTSNFIQDRSVDPLTGNVTKTFYAPDGLVYTWRQGIGVFTQAGSSSAINDPSRVGSPNIFQEPFAGQDIMNVLSLLITGTPYNFANYYKAVLGSGQFGIDPHSNQSAAFAFINSVTSQISKNNTLWGNFIPFKSLTMDEQTYAQAQFNQFTIVKQNQDLDKQIQQLQVLQQQSALLTGVKNYAPNLSTSDPNFLDTNTQINNLIANINKTIANISTQSTQFYMQAGKDPTFDYNQFIDSPGTNSVSNAQVRKELRRQINHLTRRMSYDVRANEDKNLFIVDDTYDKDYDILAYASSLVNGIKIWNNEFLSVKDKIMQTSQLLNLEVFCDTQGHIRVRAPQYNRMPSSVFYRMMYLKQAMNIQVFPDYLNDLFMGQLDTLKTQLEVLEDEIRLDCDVLAISQGQPTTDAQAIAYINAGNTTNTNNTAPNSNAGSAFNFLSDRASGNITDTTALIQQANPDVVQGQVDTSLNSVQSQANLKQVFNNIQRFTVINQASKAQQQSQGGYNTNSSTVSNNTDVNMLVSRIQTKSGQKLSPTDYLQTNVINIQSVELPANQAVDVFKTTNDLQNKISQRQNILKLFYNAIKNAAEFQSLDNSITVSNELISPAGYGNYHVPEVFEHMIEDENYDDYGPGSGSRYIIRRSQIKAINIVANAPQYTTVEVQGILDQFLSDPSNLPADLNFFPGGGNGMVTAMAIDYDMWRSYGFKGQSTIQVPFLSDPVTQCGPYAAMILSVARKNILRGSVTISGNEYMQPGEVVFLEDRGMLFYVTSVRHNFSFANTFTTTLELTYGHTPGEYIPTTMDFIGKLIYKNKNSGTTVIQRQDNSGNEINIGTFVKAPNVQSNPVGNTDSLNDGGANQTPNPTSDFNSKVMANVMFTSAYMVNNNNTPTNNITASIEIRLYYDNSTGSPDDNLLNFAEQIYNQIVGSADGPKNFPSATTGFASPPIPKESVSVVSINLDDTTIRSSPSQKAFDAARNQVASSTTAGSDPTNNTALRAALFTYIVDVWVVKTPVPSLTQTSNGS